jgi:hypothetical protein
MPCFDKGRSKLLDQRKQDKLQWLHDLIQINVGNLNNARCEAKHLFGKKKKDNINEFATHSKNKDIRDLHKGIY